MGWFTDVLKSTEVLTQGPDPAVAGEGARDGIVAPGVPAARLRVPGGTVGVSRTRSVRPAPEDPCHPGPAGDPCPAGPAERRRPSGWSGPGWRPVRHRPRDLRLREKLRSGPPPPRPPLRPPPPKSSSSMNLAPGLNGPENRCCPIRMPGIARRPSMNRGARPHPARRRMADRTADNRLRDPIAAPRPCRAAASSRTGPCPAATATIRSNGCGASAA